MVVKKIVSLVDKDKLEILAELKALNSAELIELRQEHDEMRIKVRELEIDVEQKKSLLNTVLLEKDEISKKVSEQKDLMLEKEKSNSELKATIAAFTGTAEGRDGALEKRVLQLQNKLEDHREKMTKSREVCVRKYYYVIRSGEAQKENKNAGFWFRRVVADAGRGTAHQETKRDHQGLERTARAGSLKQYRRECQSEGGTACRIQGQFIIIPTQILGEQSNPNRITACRGRSVKNSHSSKKKILLWQPRGTIKPAAYR